MDYNPLVSVGILTYNSAKYIVEALESVKNQTYQNIELIVSDDCSKDNTVEICRNWIEENKSRFVNTTLLTVEKNTGTSANCNRRFAACKGEWLKGLAADDKLLPTCIEDFVNYVNEHNKSNIIFSKVIGFGNMEAASRWPCLDVGRFLKEFSQRQLRIILSSQNFLPAPSTFIRKTVWQSIHGYNESIPLLEDWPFWVKSLEYGYSFDFLDKETVCYRFSENSISQSDRPLSKAYQESSSMALSYAKKSLSKINLFFWYFYQTRRIAQKLKLIKDKVFVFLNFGNPAYYEYNKTIAHFKDLIEIK